MVTEVIVIIGANWYTHLFGNAFNVKMSKFGRPRLGQCFESIEQYFYVSPSNSACSVILPVATEHIIGQECIIVYNVKFSGNVQKRRTQSQMDGMKLFYSMCVCVCHWDMDG